MDVLPRLAVARGERGSQGLVPLDDLVEAAFQRRHIERAAQAVPGQQVVRRIARRHLIDHPHLALDERQRRRVLIGAPGYERAFRALGRDAELASASTDANVPIALGIPAIALGAGGKAGDAHLATEWFENVEGALGIVRALLVTAAMAEVE